ncbi:MAG: hypothetical protein ACHP9Z_29720 [Streptosporangiales bacterium]
MPQSQERDLNREIRVLCERFGLHAFSTTTYRIPGASGRPGSSRGFPDWVIAGPRGVLFREAKSEDGRRSMAQVRWGKVLAAAGGNYAVWRPADLASGLIEHELETIAPAGP